MKHECPCAKCKGRSARIAQPGFGTNGRGDWKLLNTYYPQFAEERWLHWLAREQERKAQREAAEQYRCDVCGQLGARYIAALALTLCVECYVRQGS
jgi:hypothetical protein